MIINADTVEYGIDDDQIMFVWFGNTQIKPLEYFKIELAEEFDEQDVESGMDTYYIELNDQIYSTYAGIEEVSVSEGKINFKLDKTGFESLKQNSLEIGLHLNSKEYDGLKSLLKQIFKKIYNSN